MKNVIIIILSLFSIVMFIICKGYEAINDKANRQRDYSFKVMIKLSDHLEQCRLELGHKE